MYLNMFAYTHTHQQWFNGLMVTYVITSWYIAGYLAGYLAS